MHRIVIAENQSITREALRLVLEREGYDVVGEARDGLEAMQLLRTQHPDLIVAALRLRRLNGIEVIRRVRRAFSAVKILVLSEMDNASTISRCAQAGASGFVSKAADFTEFLLALKAIERGSTWFALEEIRKLGEGEHGEHDAGPLASLSQRELSVLGYLAGGMRIREIADEMALNERTISTYKSRLTSKLNVHSLVELVDFARRYHVASNANAPLDDTVDDEPELEHGETTAYPGAHALFDILPFAVALRALDGSIVFANLHLRKYLGEHRLDAFRRANIRDQARLFGTDEQTAERVASTFADAVARGVAYRMDAVSVEDGEPLIGVHWGAPLSDREGVVTMMVCGTINVNGAEQMMLGHHDEAAHALAAGAARAALLETHDQGVSTPLAQAIALLESASATLEGDEAMAATLAQAGEQLRIAALRLEQLRFLALATGKVRWPVVVRCDLREITRSVARRVETAVAILGTRFSVSCSGHGDDAVWLDDERYAQLLMALLHRAASAEGSTAIPVAMHSTLRNGGMVDVSLRVGVKSGAQGAKGIRADHADAGQSRAAQLELELCKSMANALGAQLQTSDHATPACVELILRLPRANATE
jgi:two-component system sensor histidine kinase EvgS/two-component system response regulator EvgA